MHGWRLSDVALAKQGISNIKHYWFIVNFKWRPLPLNTVLSYNAWTRICLSVTLVSLQGVFQSCEKLYFFLSLIGRAVCDGREADLYEAQARQPLHVGARLFEDLFLWALPLHSLWFWMVMTSFLSFPNRDYNVLLSWVILNFLHYMFTKQRLSFEHLIQLYLIMPACRHL